MLTIPIWRCTDQDLPFRFVVELFEIEGRGLQHFGILVVSILHLVVVAGPVEGVAEGGNQLAQLAQQRRHDGLAAEPEAAQLLDTRFDARRVTHTRLRLQRLTQ
jgi:hypothetical protein